jgi:hypothetical protein
MTLTTEAQRHGETELAGVPRLPSRYLLFLSIPWSIFLCASVSLW